MPNQSWELGFHLRSPRNWLNDPNGLCQYRGQYLFFYQYDHDWPTVDQKAWGLFTSPDLLHWTYEGVPLGFAKNVGNRQNNLYPNEWRIRHL